MKDSVKFTVYMPSGSVWPLTGYAGGTTPLDKIAELVLSSTYHPIIRIDVTYGEENGRGKPETVNTHHVLEVMRNNTTYTPEEWAHRCSTQ